MADSTIHAGERIRLPGITTDKTAAVIVLGALLFIVAVRSGFRGALGD